MKTFLLGALGYPLLEILWRGSSHYSMALAGGIACVRIKKRAKKKEASFTRRSCARWILPPLSI